MTPTKEMIDAGARALMLLDGCGLTIEGERVFCDDPRAREPNTDCICRAGAQAAIEAALSERSADDWQPIETAPKDGTLLLLLVQQESCEASNNPVENEMQYRTIGHNNCENDDEDEWHFAGWCWTHDYFVEGSGTPVAWRPLPAPPNTEESK